MKKTISVILSIALALSLCVPFSALAEDEEIPDISSEYTEDYYDDDFCNHNFTMKTVAPTCNFGGYDEYVCEECGYTYEDNFTATLGGHEDSDGDGFCDVCGRDLTVPEFIDIEPGQKFTCTESTSFKFVPFESGEYVITLQGHDVGATLYDTYHRYKDEGFVYADDPVSCFTDELEASEKYIIECSIYVSDDVSYTIELSKACEEHDFEVSKSVPATCENGGYDLLVCKNCCFIDTYYTDAPLGHTDDDLDNICDVCGLAAEEKDVPEVKTGDKKTAAPSEEFTYKFIPEKDGSYFINVKNADDLYFDLLDSFSVSIETYNEYISANEYNIKLDFTAGRTYYIDGINWSEDSSVVFTLKKACDNHDFNTTRTPATCEDFEAIVSVCKVCGYTERDYIGDNLGHIDENADNICDRCGLAPEEPSYEAMISDGDEISADAGYFMQIKFVPETDDIYILSAQTRGDAPEVYVCTVFDETIYSSFDAQNDGSVWSLACALKGGNTYFISAGSNDTPLTLELHKACEKHDVTKQVIAPTCEEIGYDIYTCKNCGYIYTTEFTESKFRHDDANNDGYCDYCGTEAYYTDGEEIKPSDTKEVTLDGSDIDFAMFTFTPGTSGEYVLKSTADSEYLDISIRNKFSVAAAYDECPERNTTKVITANLTAGTKYFIICTNWSYEVGSLTFSVTKGCDKHTLTSKTVAPTCADYGYDIETCSVCSARYVTNITSTLPHTDKDGDGICDICNLSKHTAPSKDIKAGETVKIIDADGNSDPFKFIPTESGNYTFTCDSLPANSIVVYDDYFYAVEGSYYSNSLPSSHTVVTCALEAGKTYFVSFSAFYGNVGKLTAKIEKGNGASAVFGDLDGDGEIKAKDARTALRASAGLETLSAAQIKAADVTGDGEVKAKDARLILRYAAKLETSFPVN